MVINDTQQQHDKSAAGSENLIPSNGRSATGNDRHTQPNAGAGDPTDGRKEYQWSSRYPRQAIMEIYWESLYLFVLFISSFFVIFASWKGWICFFASTSPDEAIMLKRYTYYTSSGLLGGVVFGIKYFYRVIARGYWHQDRRIWRLMSPLIAMAVAFIVGTMIDASFIATGKHSSGQTIISIGFLAGYFADQAVAKMYEIANVIFGKSATTKAGDGK